MLKTTLTPGTIVQGVIQKHWPFGVFVNLSGIPFVGLIQITDFKDEGRMTPDEYPPVGSPVEAVVLGFKDTGNQIWLGVKPSQLANG
jgi:ribosomal protein S1